MLGLAGGRESILWYWFLSGVYAQKFSSHDLVPGNDLKYSGILGIRPHPINYYTPDLVLFIEILGNWSGSSRQNGNAVSGTEGHTWSLAPTFMLTYRNLALRGGFQFGLASAGGVPRSENLVKATVEWHL